MQYHKQLNKRDPENGVFGDCYRTAVACILDKHPSEVIHSVVCYKGKAIHDPHPSDDFLCGPCDDGFWHVEIIVRPI